VHRMRQGHRLQVAARLSHTLTAAVARDVVSRTSAAIGRGTRSGSRTAERSLVHAHHSTAVECVKARRRASGVTVRTSVSVAQVKPSVDLISGKQLSRASLGAHESPEVGEPYIAERRSPRLSAMRQCQCQLDHTSAARRCGRSWRQCAVGRSAQPDSSGRGRGRRA
jgi:hypothetical protein